MSRPGMDPFDRLRRLDPFPTDSMPGSESDLGQAILRRVLASTEGQQSRKKRRPLARFALALLGLLAIGATAYAMALTLRDPTGVVCHETASLDGKRVVVARPDALDVSACNQAWLSGTLGSAKHTAVPPLAGCVSGEGVLFVFPTPDTSICSDLGLGSTAGIEPSDVANLIADLNRQLLAYFAENDCVSVSEAVRVAESLLLTTGVDGWSARMGSEPTEDRPCASFSIDPSLSAVVIVPVPPPPAAQGQNP